LAAIGVFKAFAIKPEQIQKIVKKINGIPGRMEDIPNNQ